MDATLTKTLNRIDSKLTALLNKQKQETWVKVYFIQDLTGWDSKRLEQAREQKIIQFRKSKSGSYEYLLESLPELFIKKTA